MSTPFEIGKSITASTQLISQVGIECEHLINFIKEEISRFLIAPDISRRCRPAGEWIDIASNDKHGWVCIDIGASLPIKFPRKRAHHYLFLQISLAGDGVNAKNNVEPIIHIGMWKDALDFDGVRMSFPMEVAADFLENQRLFIWQAKQDPSEWCFSVRLTDINSPQDVRTHLIEPLGALLLEGVQSNVFDSTYAVKYTQVEGAYGQYEVLPR